MLLSLSLSHSTSIANSTSRAYASLCVAAASAPVPTIFRSSPRPITTILRSPGSLVVIKLAICVASVWPSSEVSASVPPRTVVAVRCGEGRRESEDEGSSSYVKGAVVSAASEVGVRGTCSCMVAGLLDFCSCRVGMGAGSFER